MCLQPNTAGCAAASLSCRTPVLAGSSPVKAALRTSSPPGLRADGAIPTCPARKQRRHGAHQAPRRLSIRASDVVGQLLNADERVLDDRNRGAGRATGLPDRDAKRRLRQQPSRAHRVAQATPSGAAKPRPIDVVGSRIPSPLPVTTSVQRAGGRDRTRVGRGVEPAIAARRGSTPRRTEDARRHPGRGHAAAVRQASSEALPGHVRPETQKGPPLLGWPFPR